LRRLSTCARLISFGAPSLEERMDDVRAVMDAVGSKRAAVVGFSNGRVMSALFAATYPEGVLQLILFGGFAAATMLPEDWQARVAQRTKLWDAVSMINTVWPSQARNPDAVALVLRAPEASGLAEIKG
jgi:pimeloyl-ACP methyl ester carboxylesterase